MSVTNPPSLRHLRLGASLYVPATHSELASLADGKYPQLKSLIIDTEDAVELEQLGAAYANLRQLLRHLAAHPRPDRPLLFVRVRNPLEFERVKALPHIEQLDGFVFPKFHTGNMREYMRRLLPGKYYMPILEKHIFEHGEVNRIRDYLLDFRESILSIRIGATDLLSSFDLRRDCQTLIYDIGVIKHVITQIVLSFRPHGFNVCGPVFECFDPEHFDLLREETRLDLLSGLFGKTIIHPSQIEVVQAVYRPSPAEYKVARQLLDPAAPAVFKRYGQMHEKATHSGWARNVLERAHLYGVRQEESQLALLHCL